MGITCSVASLSFSPRLDVKARNRPSGDQAGWASLGPAVIGPGAPSGPLSHTLLVVVFSSRSIVATTKAMREPSGETAGPETQDRPWNRSRSWSENGDVDESTAT